MRRWILSYENIATDPKASGWVLKSGNDVIIGRVMPKTMAVVAAALRAGTAATHDDPISLVVRKRNGQFQEERTFPRSADPNSSRGLSGPAGGK